MKLIKGKKYDPDSLTLTGWSGPDTDGYHVGDYFRSQDGAYLGPDQDGIEPEFLEPEDLYLYDSDTNDMLSAEDIGITDAEYVAACADSMAAAPEGHVMVAGRRVYAAE